MDDHARPDPRPGRWRTSFHRTQASPDRDLPEDADADPEVARTGRPRHPPGRAFRSATGVLRAHRAWKVVGTTPVTVARVGGDAHAADSARSGRVRPFTLRAGLVHGRPGRRTR